MSENRNELDYAVETLDELTEQNSLQWLFMLVAGALFSLLYVGWWIAGDVLRVQGTAGLVIVHAVVAYLFASILMRSSEQRRLRGLLSLLRSQQT